MYDLAAHIARVTCRRYPASVVPPELRSTILQMGHVAERIVAKAGSVIARGTPRSRSSWRDDDEMDKPIASSTDHPVPGLKHGVRPRWT
jgi:phosphate transport system protein